MGISSGVFARRSVIVAMAIAGAALGPRAAAQGPGTPLADRIRGARMVVVAAASTVTPRWQENAFGDRLIVSRVLLRVEETLKGMPQPTLALDLEGGTIDGVTLHVSNYPTLTPGERAVFMLDDEGGGVYQAHLRGQGILKLDEKNVVRGSSLQLDEIRRVAASARN